MNRNTYVGTSQRYTVPTSQLEKLHLERKIGRKVRLREDSLARVMKAMENDIPTIDMTEQYDASPAWQQHEHAGTVRSPFATPAPTPPPPQIPAYGIQRHFLARSNRGSWMESTLPYELEELRYQRLVEQEERAVWEMMHEGTGDSYPGPGAKKPSGPRFTRYLFYSSISLLGYCWYKRISPYQLAKHVVGWISSRWHRERMDGGLMSDGKPWPVILENAKDRIVSSWLVDVWQTKALEGLTWLKEVCGLG